MGALSDITSGKVEVNLVTSIFDTIESAFAKAYCAIRDNNDSPAKNSKDENFEIGKDNVKLNNSNVEIVQSPPREFIKIDNAISSGQTEAILDVVNRLPSGISEYMMETGWQIRVIDVNTTEFTSMHGYDNRTNEIGGITMYRSNTIEFPNLNDNSRTYKELYNEQSNSVAHEIGHIIDKALGVCSNSTDWRNAFEQDKAEFVNLANRSSYYKDENMLEFFRTFPEEAFAETFASYCVDGNSFDFINRYTPHMAEYMDRLVPLASEYFENLIGENPNKNAFENFFERANPNTDMETHEFNHFVPLENGPSYKDF